jgi:hypothetical protein
MTGTMDCHHTYKQARDAALMVDLMLHQVHDFGEEEPHFRRDRPSWIGLLNQVEAFVHYLIVALGLACVPGRASARHRADLLALAAVGSARFPGRAASN